MQQSRTLKLDRFNKPSKELLVNFINKKNNRGLSPDQLIFGTPVLKQEDGLSEVEISFDPSTGWSAPDQKRTLGYFRTNLEVELNKQPLVVHVAEEGTDILLKAIEEQYGLVLEKDLVVVELVARDVSDSAPVTEVPGFDPEAAPEESEEEVVPPYLDNRNYRITFKDEHLIFFGGLDVYTRRSLELLGNTIDSLIDLREFYRDGNFDLPKAEMFFEGGELYINEENYPQYIDRKAAAALLYELPLGPIMVESELATILRKLTGDPWVVEDAEYIDFNLYRSEVIYNGFVKVEYGLKKAAYNYVIAIKLGQPCANLTGYIKIGYQFSSSKIPGNIAENFASVMPLFPR